jgi:hypothetical protein
LVKVFRENRIFSNDRQYIGFSIVELKKDEKIRIYCRPESSIEVSIFNSNNDGIENVKCLLGLGNNTISESFTDGRGVASLKIPTYSSKQFKLKVIYQGFLVKEKNVKFNFLSRFIPKKESLSIKQFTLNVKIKDTWGFNPEVEVNPTVSSNEMVEQVLIPAEKINEGQYAFNNLYPANYFINMKYKSFELKKDVEVCEVSTIDITFPAEFELNFYSMNNYGYTLSNGKISVSRNDKSEIDLIDKNGKTEIMVPPGKYNVNVYLENKEIAKQEIDVRGDKKINILTSQESFIHTILIYLSIILAISCVGIIIWKKKIYTCIKIFTIALLIFALFSPWWILNGDDGGSKTVTKTLLVPPKIITFSESTDVLGGDVSILPSEATMVLNLLSIIITISCLIIFITIFTKDKLKKITKILDLFSIILIILTISIFFYAMSQITEVGVGTFIGSGDIDISFPGITENRALPSNWGPSVGFYLGLIALLILSIFMVYNKIKKRIQKNNKRSK